MQTTKGSDLIKNVNSIYPDNPYMDYSIHKLDYYETQLEGKILMDEAELRSLIIEYEMTLPNSMVRGVLIKQIKDILGELE